MKETELRRHSTCALCGKKVGETGLPLFWRITVERFGIDLKTVRRQDGLAQLMGSTVLADVMGPGEDMTVTLMEPKALTVCETCAMEKLWPLVAAGLETTG